MTIDVDHFAAKLRARRDHLNSLVHKIETTLDEPPSKDFEERATEREGVEVMESLGNMELNEIRQIDAALARVEDGSYGICVNCGGDISAERLEVVPHAPRCRNCA